MGHLPSPRVANTLPHFLNYSILNMKKLLLLCKKNRAVHTYLYISRLASHLPSWQFGERFLPLKLDGGRLVLLGY